MSVSTTSTHTWECDRCGRTEEVEHDKPEAWRILATARRRSDLDIDDCALYRDICGWCAGSLNDWLNGVQTVAEWRG